ncbi:cytochrome P450 [Emericellopsis atlantica]|uniref:Cytochrome P450 n=1 Tax=Emericellopsis atlantica TaxID=2614577 RepID=A0A9P8CN82_9HYPO|nr:cytochrome P450 [Emericellopsis atlantica]KAG9253243.1 cytochrome P450 [Emericellopsis atlantica]
MAQSPYEAVAPYLSLGRVLLLSCAGWIVFKILQALYNISPLHPLSKVPGPKLTAATYWPEFYHDVILTGRFTHEIKKMHDEYGPIVRINPHETHCADMAFADEIYAIGGRKRDKPIHQINGSAVGTTNGFGTPDHDLHRSRRVPVARFFSRAMIARLEGDLHDLVQKLCDKLLAEGSKATEGEGKKKEPFDIAHAYSCFTSDAIFSYSFGEPLGLLSRDAWTPNFREATLAVLKPVFIFRFFPFLIATSRMGKHLVPYLPPDAALLIRTLQIDIPSRVYKTKHDLDAGISYDRPTVFGDLLQSELDESEKNPERLADEAVAVVGAGTETTSWALAVITFHLLSQPAIMDKLRAELLTVVDDPRHLPAWTVLEKLPYLGAVIQEGLRLSYGVSSRSARTPTEEDLVYRGEWNKKPMELVLPRGYAIGMSAAITHHDESIFPDSYSYIPERWLDEKNEFRKDVAHGMMAFSKGSRACLGKNLALCELHLALAALVLRVMPHMRLVDTTQEDIAYDHDMFVPMAKSGSRGVKVLVDTRINQDAPSTIRPQCTPFLSHDTILLQAGEPARALPEPSIGGSALCLCGTWNDDLDPRLGIITPVGLPLGIITTSSIFLFFSLLFAGIRSHVRWQDRVFGWDDGLMVAGTIAHVASVSVGIAGQLTGIGTRDVHLNQWRFEESMKIHTVWLLAYSLAMTLIKASICITLRRIAEAKRSLRIVVWILLAITLVSFIAAFVGTAVQCIPFEAHWRPYLVDQGDAWCAPTVIFIVLGYIATVCTIVTDAALVVVPGMLLWKTQMKMQAKLQVMGLMSFASLASLITVVRIPYVQKYGGLKDRHYWCAMIVFCSIIESSIGIIASSFPSVRRFVRRLRNNGTDPTENNYQPNTDDIITFGGGGGGSGGASSKQQGRGSKTTRSAFHNPTDVGISLTTVKGRTHGEKWERLNDGDSDKRDLLRKESVKGIRAQYTYTVEVEEDTDGSMDARSKPRRSLE